MFTWVLGNPCKRDLELELFSALKIFFHPPTTVNDNNHWSRGSKVQQDQNNQLIIWEGAAKQRGERVM